MDNRRAPDEKWENPYAPPQTASTSTVSAQLVGELPLATQWQRLVNFVVDMFLVRVWTTGIGLGLGLALMWIWPEALDWMIDQPLVGWVVDISSFVLYFLVFEATLGRTPGKWITGTKVVNEDGSPPSAETVLWRTLIRMVPFEPFSYLGANRPRGWHDRWSGTCVIQLWGKKFDSRMP